MSRARLHKVADQIQKELSEIVRRELRDPRIGMVTFTGVEVSPDFSHAKVYFTVLDKDHLPHTLDGLRRAAGYLRSRLAHAIKLYATPELHFFYDESVERGDRLSRLIDSVSEPK